MLLKEQALKRFQSQFKFEHKKGHRRTKSLDDDWDPETETIKARNDKITDKDRVRADEDEGEVKEAGNKDKYATTDGKEGHGKGEREGRSPYLMMRRDREREKDKEKEKEKKEDKDDQHQRHKDGRSWEKDFLAGYARLKQHYTSKLQTSDGGQHQHQQHQPPPAGSSTSASVTTPPTIKRGSWWEDHAGQHQQTYLSGMALETGSSEWAAPEEPFTYYDISPTSKMEGIVSKCLKTKFAPFFFEVHTGCIIYDRISFKGSIALRGGESAVEVKHSQGPLPRVLFEQTEGHIFWIQYREGEASSSPAAAAGASPAGTSDRRELSLAASSKDEMMDWVHVMRGPRQKGSKRKRRGKEKAHNNINGAGGPATPESPEKAPAAVAGDDSLESTDSPPAWKKEGWLWVKSSRPGDVWSSYYCLANEYTFEWFKRGVKQMISLENVTEIKTKVLPKAERVRSTTFLSTKKQAATTTNSVHLQSLKDYAYKITLEVNAKIPYKERLMGKFKFMVDSEERMSKWVSSVRGQLGKPPRIGKKHLETPLGQAKTFRSTVAMRAPKGTPTKIQTALTKINTTPETGKAWLHNFLRDIAERGDAEMGKTPLGNYRTDVPMPKDGKYRVITFDGGGLRSVVSIIILERLVEVFPDLLERVNLFCGTSGGAILATSLAMGRSPTWIKTIMVAFGKHIFTRKARQFVTTARYDNNTLGLMGEEMFGALTLKDVPRSLIITAFQLDNGRVGEDFHSWIPRIFHNLPAAHPRPASHFPPGHKSRTGPGAAEREKESKQGSTPERDTSMERLVASVPPAIPSSKAASVSGAATSSFYGSLGGSGRSLTSTSGSPPSVAALVAASAMAGGSAGGVGEDDALPHAGPAGEAAGDDEVGGGAGKDEEEPPSGFPVPTWPSEEDLSLPLSDLLMGSAAAPTFFPTHKGFVDGGIFAHNPCMTAVASVISPEHANQQKLSQLEVLSLGTGRIAQYVEGEDLDWGIMQWARKLPDMIFGGAVWNAALLCRMQLGKSFHRLDPILEKPIPMDDPTQMAEIINVGMQIDLDDTIDWIREHFYGMESKKHQRKKKPKLKPRRKAGGSQWWGQSQLFGEMFSSDEDAINQSRAKKEDMQKKKRGWLKSKLGKSGPDYGSSGDDEEEESYEEYIKHTITETDDDSPAHDEADDDDSDSDNGLDDEMDHGAYDHRHHRADHGDPRGGKAKEELGDDVEAVPRADIIIRSGDGEGGSTRPRATTLPAARADAARQLRRHPKGRDKESVDQPEAEAEAEAEEEEDDLKTEVEMTVSDTDSDTDSPGEPDLDRRNDSVVAQQKRPQHHHHQQRVLKEEMEEEEEERDTSDKESEAMVEEESLAEMERDVVALEREIARLAGLKREREQKMEAILRRRERERKLQHKREAREREKARLRVRHLEKASAAGASHKRAPAAAKEEPKKERGTATATATTGHQQRTKGVDSGAAPLFTSSRDHPPVVAVAVAIEPDDDADDDAGTAPAGKAKECERDEGEGRVEVEEGEEDGHEEEEAEEADERGLVEVINSFLRRDKKDHKDHHHHTGGPSAHKWNRSSDSNLGARDHGSGGKEKEKERERRRAEKEREKEEAGKKAETLSPAARRKIFHTFSTSSFSTISSHLPSFAFHSSDKVDKAADRLPESGSSAPGPSAAKTGAATEDEAGGGVGGGDNDEEREREREKKGHSNIATFINRRISDLREHRRKRSASVPTPDNAREGEDAFSEEDD